MSAGRIRKLTAIREVTGLESGVEVDPPLTVAVAAVVIENSFAGRYEADLQPLIEQHCDDLGRRLTAAVTELLDGAPVEAFGKCALVGTNGDVEHGSAIIHNLIFGNHLREAIGATALLPAAEKRGPTGATIDIPLKHTTDQLIRSHHMTFELRVADAPLPDEILIAVACATGGRPHARIGTFAQEVSEA